MRHFLCLFVEEFALKQSVICSDCVTHSKNLLFRSVFEPKLSPDCYFDLKHSARVEEVTEVHLLNFMSMSVLDQFL